MQFGVFDHLDADGTALGTLYANRLKLIEAYERIGLYCYHLAEHHATPLGMSPSPSVFLAAAAQRTSTLLLGPLVYTLALYHPLRLAEEICMLDHLSGGRLQLGVGRGVSPIELSMFGVEVAKGQARYVEAYDVVMKALTSTLLNHEGEAFQFRDVPIQMAPLQKPHPPLWYGVGNPDATAWVAQQGINAVCLAPPKIVRTITDRYRAEWSRLGRSVEAMPMLGLVRHLVIADTDDEALAIARRAYAYWHRSFWYLWNEHNKLGVKPPFAAYPPSFDELIARDQAIAGSPETVRNKLRAQVDESGATYVLLDLAFGDLTLAESMRTVDLFAQHVKPAFA